MGPLLRSSSSSSLFSDGSTGPLIRPIHQSGPPAVPPRGDQFHYLPQRPTFFRYASHSAQTPASGFFNPRPIVFDQGSQTSPVWRNPDRQGPRHTGPLEDHQQPSGAVQSPFPGYSRSTMAGPSPFRPVARGRTLSSSRPVRPFATSSSGSPPPTVFTVSPSQSEPHLPPPPFEASSSRPRSQSLVGPAAAATSTSTPSSSAAEFNPWRSRSPLWPPIPPFARAPTSGASSASSSASARAISRATSDIRRRCVGGRVGFTRDRGFRRPPHEWDVSPISDDDCAVQLESGFISGTISMYALLYLSSWLNLVFFCAPLSFYAPFAGQNFHFIMNRVSFFS